MTMELDTILCGDSLNMLKALPESSVHCCVTSPPYPVLCLAILFHLSKQICF